MNPARYSYLDLLKRCLTRTLYEPATAGRIAGMEWPAEAETMIGYARLTNIVECVDTVIAEDVPGDLCEAGVWRGGAAIMMKAALETFDHRQSRVVWVADSFKGLPPPNPDYEYDVGDLHHTFDHLAVSVDEVRGNFYRYSLLDDRVKFIEGWFSESLPGPIEQLAVLRCDGDMYGSTYETLTALEPLVSPRGYIIIDDYFLLDGCRHAVDDYRYERDLHEQIHRIDRCGAFWRKT